MLYVNNFSVMPGHFPGLEPVLITDNKLSFMMHKQCWTFNSSVTSRVVHY